MKFRLKPGVGVHYTGTKRHKAGEVVVSDDHLDKMFANKFERVHEEEGKKAIPAALKELPPDEQDNSGEEAAPTQEQAPATQDVTDKFDGTEEKELKVLKSGDTYMVYAATDLEASLTEKPLTKAGVKKFIANY